MMISNKMNWRRNKAVPALWMFFLLLLVCIAGMSGCGDRNTFDAAGNPAPAADVREIAGR